MAKTLDGRLVYADLLRELLELLQLHLHGERLVAAGVVEDVHDFQLFAHELLQLVEQQAEVILRPHHVGAEGTLERHFDGVFLRVDEALQHHGDGDVDVVVVDVVAGWQPFFSPTADACARAPPPCG